MKVLCYALLALLFAAAAAQAQVTNLKVNGLGANFTMTSGDPISWQYNVPAGDTTMVEIYLDLNGNGAIDPGTDAIYTSFSQIDGVSNPNGGPPDDDGLKNGAVTFSMPVGLAPAAYVMRFTDHSAPVTIAGTVTPMASPAHTISGKVTVPPGKSAQNIVVELHRSDKYGLNFWDALTDAGGNYTIRMNADTAGNPWQLRVNSNPFPPDIVAPDQSSVLIVGDPSGFNFTIEQAAAQVAGLVVDETGQVVSDRDVSLAQPGTSFSRNARTDPWGRFQIGLLSGELVSKPWTVQANQNGYYTSSVLQALASLPPLVPGDSLFRKLTVYSVNSQISGTVRLNGGAPGSMMDIVAVNSDSAEATASVDGGTGNFTIPVSSRVANYQLVLMNTPNNLSYTQVTAHPGQSGVLITLGTTSVAAKGAPQPLTFGLDQNWPNPFNPTTTVSYRTGPGAGSVKLVVTDLLGREVAVLASGEQAPGSYSVRFDAGKLAAGVYLCRLQANGRTETRKMLLVK